MYEYVWNASGCFAKTQNKKYYVKLKTDSELAIHQA